MPFYPLLVNFIFITMDRRNTIYSSTTFSLIHNRDFYIIFHKKQYLIISSYTNLASRLEQVCQPGEVYISHTTWALINNEIPCEEVDTIEVKGFHYPVQTYRVL